MMFTLIDVILAVLVIGFVLFGLYYGFVHTLGSLIGSVIALIATGYITPFVATWLGGFVHVGPVVQTIIFVLIFVILFRVVGFFFWIIEKTVGLVAKLPFIRSIDRILGLVIGFAEGVLVAGIIIELTLRYFGGGSVAQAMMQSDLGTRLHAWTQWIIAWLPF